MTEAENRTPDRGTPARDEAWRHAGREPRLACAVPVSLPADYFRSQDRVIVR